MAELLKGKPVSDYKKGIVLAEVDNMRYRGIFPRLAIVRIGENPDDLSYERSVIKQFEKLGIDVSVFSYPEDIAQEDFVSSFRQINGRSDVHGILLFRPLPKHIDIEAVKAVFDPQKDVDCMLNDNLAKVFASDHSGFAPCTAQAVVSTLEYYKVDLTGKRVCIVGRSLVVGKPLAMLMLEKNATVTICHTRTKDLAAECRNADIIVAAAGRANMIDDSFVSEGAIVLDVGINVDEHGCLCGDVDFDRVKDKVSMITPVPGGIGAVTTALLAQHVVKAAKKISKL